MKWGWPTRRSFDDGDEGLLGFFPPVFLVFSTAVYVYLSEYSEVQNCLGQSPKQSAWEDQNETLFELGGSSPRRMDQVWKPVCKAMLRSVLVTTALAIKGTKVFSSSPCFG